MVKISTKDACKTLTKSVRTGTGRLKTTEPTARGRAKYVANASQVCNRYEVSKLGNLITKQGWETSERRNLLGFKKSSAKMAETFDAHNVDSWVLASFVTGKSVIDNKAVFRMIPLQLHRRQLHRFEPDKGGVRRPYGGTLSMGMKRGSVVNHTRLGRVYIGGTLNGKISLHDLQSGKRLTQSGSIKDCSFLHFNSWRTSWIQGFASSTGTRPVVSAHKTL